MRMQSKCLTYGTHRRCFNATPIFRRRVVEVISPPINNLKVTTQNAEARLAPELPLEIRHTTPKLLPIMYRRLKPRNQQQL